MHDDGFPPLLAYQSAWNDEPAEIALCEKFAPDRTVLGRRGGAGRLRRRGQRERLLHVLQQGHD